jgi:hypothetical protein
MKKTITLLAILFLAVTLNAQVEPMDTDADGYRNVSTLDNLKWISENSISWADDFKLDNDIDASATSSWTEYTDITGFKPIALGFFDEFTGTFDGNGFKIIGLYIHSDVNGTFPALFRKTEYATIRNLTLENCDIFSSDVGAAALIADCNTTTINNCHSSGTINGIEFIGGLIAKADSSTITNCSSSINLPSSHNYVGGLIASAKNNSTISDSYTTGDVIGNDDVGGFIGYCNSSSIDNCYATGTVTGDSKYTGGFAGYNYEGTISNSHALGSVTLSGGASENAGGFIGTNISGTISSCYAMGNVYSEDTDVGGFAGHNDGTIEKSYAIGNVTGYSVVGGFVGANEISTAIIQNCYCRGDVIATVSGHQNVGGFAGENTVQAQLVNCYSTGKVTSPNSTFSDIGGFLGSNNSSAPTSYQGIVTNSYWDNITSNLTTSNGGEGKSTSNMKTEGTFNTWNFTAIWTIEATENDGYPHLSNFVAGVQSIANNIEFSISPNPSNDFIYINSDLNITDIQIFDITGKLVTQINNDNNVIDVSNLRTGIYLLSVKTDKGNGVSRFVKN